MVAKVNGMAPQPPHPPSHERAAAPLTTAGGVRGRSCAVRLCLAWAEGAGEGAWAEGVCSASVRDRDR